jgi:hypothetical protein
MVFYRPPQHQPEGFFVPRPILILVIIVVLIVAAMFALAALDHEVPTTHVEQPVTNAASN